MAAAVRLWSMKGESNKSRGNQLKVIRTLITRAFLVVTPLAGGGSDHQTNIGDGVGKGMRAS